MSALSRAWRCQAATTQHAGHTSCALHRMTCTLRSPYSTTKPATRSASTTGLSLMFLLPVSSCRHASKRHATSHGGASSSGRASGGPASGGPASGGPACKRLAKHGIACRPARGPHLQLLGNQELLLLLQLDGAAQGGHLQATREGVRGGRAGGGRRLACTTWTLGPTVAHLTQPLSSSVGRCCCGPPTHLGVGQRAVRLLKLLANVLQRLDAVLVDQQVEEVGGVLRRGQRGGGGGQMCVCVCGVWWWWW